MYDCRKCGAKHGMVIENKLLGTVEPIDFCNDCLFRGSFGKLLIETQGILIDENNIDVDIVDEIQMNIETWLQDK